MFHRRALLIIFFSSAAAVAGCGDDMATDASVDSSVDSSTADADGGGDATPDADGGGDAGDGGTGWTWDLPPGFPEPRVPDDNPMNAAKVELGRYLFYDTRLSFNETASCSTCHVQSMGFTDGLAHAMGSEGATHPRSSMGLTNVSYQATMTWANDLVRTVEAQAVLPIFGESPIVELGMSGKEDLLLERLSMDADYPTMFAEAFPDDSDPITVANLAKAIGAFERTLISGSSPYDRFAHGDETAMSESAQRGMELFFGERFECFHCHGGFNFSASVDHAGTVFEEATFFNTGLYNIDGRGAYPPDNTGLEAISGDPDDMGRFKPPTLRNIAVTAPYMHDGSIATLEEVLEHYARGGRNVTEGPYVGDGADNPYKSIFVSGFSMTDQERDDVIAFLEALTDDEFLTNPAFSNPFE
jgi:cytochrome c peroxidase